MAHVLQVGAGSGGMVVLDLVARDPRVTRLTIVEPDVYSAHNAHRHFFPQSSAGRWKGDLAAEWIRGFRPDLAVRAVLADLTDPTREEEFRRLASECDLGVCAVDNEPAKYAFDALMRSAGKPWTMGEVLSGGIGGWVHRFDPAGPCYGCVASYLQRNASDEAPTAPPNYSHPQGAIGATTIPASKASIAAIASIHALVSLELLDCPAEAVSHLFALQAVPGVFDEAFARYRFRAPRSPACLICSSGAPQFAGDDLDVAIDQALGRLAPL